MKTTESSSYCDSFDRRLRLVFGNPQGAGLGARDIAGDATDIRVIVVVDDDLVVGPMNLKTMSTSPTGSAHTTEPSGNNKSAMSFFIAWVSQEFQGRGRQRHFAMRLRIDADRAAWDRLKITFQASPSVERIPGRRA